VKSILDVILILAGLALIYIGNQRKARLQFKAEPPAKRPIEDQPRNPADGDGVN
jgi:hypothetical protein